MSFLEEVHKAGVIGAGGAGFPTHIKLNAKVKTLIINAAECEPLLQTDKYLMKIKAETIISTAEITGKHVGAADIVIALKGKYKNEILVLQSSINHLKSKVKLFEMGNFYPAGDEMAMVKDVTGESVPPAGIPSAVGAVVVNVNTLCNIADALNDKPVTHKLVSVLGEVKKQVVLNVPVGISVRECIACAGGSTIDDYVVVKGGPMMGAYLSENELNEAVITKKDGSILLIHKNSHLSNMKKLSVKHMINRAISVCIQCKYCTMMCPRYLLGHPLEPHMVMRNVGKKDIRDECFNDVHICCECGVCELYACPMGLSPREVNVYLKKERTKLGIKFQSTGEEVVSHKEREYRKIPADRLLARIGLTKYKSSNIQECVEVSTKCVKISLQQHIGKPAQPVVKTGDRVKVGQLVAGIDRDQVGANVHASIDGTVSVTTEAIIIEAK